MNGRKFINKHFDNQKQSSYILIKKHVLETSDLGDGKVIYLNICRGHRELFDGVVQSVMTSPRQEKDKIPFRSSTFPL